MIKHPIGKVFAALTCVLFFNSSLYSRIDQEEYRGETKQSLPAIASASCTSSQMISDEQIKKTSKKQIVIVTNLEDILIKKNWPSIISCTIARFLKSGNKLELTKLLFSFSFLRDCYLAARKELYHHGNHLLHKNEYISYFARTYSALAKYEQDIFDILHEYALNEEMIAFYLWLKISKNYSLFVATNKNKVSYKIIKSKLNRILQKRFGIGWKDLFDGGFYLDKLEKTTGTLFTQAAKPDAHYFLGLWHYLCGKRGYSKDSTHLMYIDDAEQNILAAQATHHEYAIPIEGVYYKHPNQIKHAITLLAESLEKNISEALE